MRWIALDNAIRASDYSHAANIELGGTADDNPCTRDGALIPEVREMFVTKLGTKATEAYEYYGLFND